MSQKNIAPDHDTLRTLGWRFKARRRPGPRGNRWVVTAHRGDESVESKAPSLKLAWRTVEEMARETDARASVAVSCEVTTCDYVTATPPR